MNKLEQNSRLVEHKIEKSGTLKKVVFYNPFTFVRKYNQIHLNLSIYTE